MLKVRPLSGPVLESAIAKIAQQIGWCHPVTSAHQEEIGFCHPPIRSRRRHAPVLGSHLRQALYQRFFKNETRSACTAKVQLESPLGTSTNRVQAATPQVKKKRP